MPTLELLPELITANELCERWHINRSTLTRWLQRGLVPGTTKPFLSMRIGNRLYWTPEMVMDIEELMVRVPKSRALGRPR